MEEVGLTDFGSGPGPVDRQEAPMPMLKSTKYKPQNAAAVLFERCKKRLA